MFLPRITCGVHLISGLLKVETVVLSVTTTTELPLNALGGRGEQVKVAVVICGSHYLMVNHQVILLVITIAERSILSELPCMYYFL